MSGYTNPAWNDPMHLPPRLPPPHKPLPPPPPGNPVPPPPLKYRPPLEITQQSTPPGQLQSSVRNGRRPRSHSSSDISPISSSQQIRPASEARSVSPMQRSRKSLFTQFQAVARTRPEAVESAILPQDRSSPTGSSEYSEGVSPSEVEEPNIYVPAEPPQIPPLPFGNPARPSSIIAELQQHCPHAKRAAARAGPSMLSESVTPEQHQGASVEPTAIPPVASSSATARQPAQTGDPTPRPASWGTEHEGSSGSTEETLIPSNPPSAPSDPRSAGSSGRSRRVRESQAHDHTAPTNRLYTRQSSNSGDTGDTLLPTRDGEELDTLPATVYEIPPRAPRPRDGGGQDVTHGNTAEALPLRTDTQGQEILRPTVYIPPTRYRRARNQAGQVIPRTDSTETLRPRRQDERIEVPHVAIEVPPLRVAPRERNEDSQIRSEILEDMALLHGPVPITRPRRVVTAESQQLLAGAVSAVPPSRADQIRLGVLPSVSSLSHSPSPPLTENSIQRTPPSKVVTPQRSGILSPETHPSTSDDRRFELPPTRHGEPPLPDSLSGSPTLLNAPTTQSQIRQATMIRALTIEALEALDPGSQRRPTLRSRPPIWSRPIVETAAEAQIRATERRVVPSPSPSASVHVSRRRPLTSITLPPEEDRTPSGESQISIVRIEPQYAAPVPNVPDDLSDEGTIFLYRSSPELRAVNVPPPRDPQTPLQEGRARNATPTDCPSSGTSSVHFPKPRRPEFPAPEDDPTYAPSTPLPSRSSVRLRDPTLAERERQQLRHAAQQQESTGSPNPARRNRELDYKAEHPTLERTLVQRSRPSERIRDPTLAERERRALRYAPRQQATTGSPGPSRSHRDNEQQARTGPPAPLHERPLRGNVRVEPRPLYGGSPLTAKSPVWPTPGQAALPQERVYKIPQRDRQVGYTFDRETGVGDRPRGEARHTRPLQQRQRRRRSSDNIPGDVIAHERDSNLSFLASTYSSGVPPSASLPALHANTYLESSAGPSRPTHRLVDDIPPEKDTRQSFVTTSPYSSGIPEPLGASLPALHKNTHLGTLAGPSRPTRQPSAPLTIEPDFDPRFPPKPPRRQTRSLEILSTTRDPTSHFSDPSTSDALTDRNTAIVTGLRIRRSRSPFDLFTSPPIGAIQQKPQAPRPPNSNTKGTKPPPLSQIRGTHGLRTFAPHHITDETPTQLPFTPSSYSSTTNLQQGAGGKDRGPNARPPPDYPRGTWHNLMISLGIQQPQYWKCCQCGEWNRLDVPLEPGTDPRLRLACRKECEKRDAMYPREVGFLVRHVKCGKCQRR